MIDRRQVRMARAALGWSIQVLAMHAKVGEATVRRLEQGHASTIPAILSAIETALTTAGLEFIPENGGGVGVRLRKAGVAPAPSSASPGIVISPRPEALAVANGTAASQKRNLLGTRVPLRIWLALDALVRTSGIRKNIIVQEAVRRYLARELPRHKIAWSAELQTIPTLSLPDPKSQFKAPYPWQDTDIEYKQKPLNLTFELPAIINCVSRISNNINMQEHVNITQKQIYTDSIRELLEEELPKWGATL